MRFALLGCLLLTIFSAAAQMIAQGPVFGAVTDTSMRVYLRSGDALVFKLRYSENENLADYGEIVQSTRRDKDYSTIINIGGLKPDTRYHFLFLVNNRPDSIRASVRTFPADGQRGNYTFTAGSCQETENMKVFDRIRELDPYFLLHTGDYTYPDYQIRPDYSDDYQTVAHSYHKRYDEKRMKQMLQTVPIDYIFDDNDHVGSGSGKYYKNDHHCEGDGLMVRCYPDSNRFPDHWLRNVIAGYTEFFPGYELPDTTVGVHHSFRFGNAEFFFLDRNSAKPRPVSAAFRWHTNKRGKRGRWVFDPTADHCLFCKEQMDWLKAGLKDSDADWKFIVSGVPLNKSILKLILAGLKLQRFKIAGYGGYHMAHGFSSYWAAHPHELVDFHEWMEAEGMDDIIVISGDTHHNLIDNGRNAGLPELNASGLSVDKTHLAWYLKIVGLATGMFRMKQEVWNRGGNGLGNRNFKNAYGRVDIVENRYVKLSIIDEDGEEVARHKVYHSSYEGKRTSK